MNVLEYYMKKGNLLVRARNGGDLEAVTNELNELNSKAAQITTLDPRLLDAPDYWTKMKVRMAISGNLSMGRAAINPAPIEYDGDGDSYESSYDGDDGDSTY